MKPIVLYHYDADGLLQGSTAIPSDSVRVIADLVVTSALLVGRKIPSGPERDEIVEALRAADDVLDTLDVPTT